MSVSALHKGDNEMNVFEQLNKFRLLFPVSLLIAGLLFYASDVNWEKGWLGIGQYVSAEENGHSGGGHSSGGHSGSDDDGHVDGHSPGPKGSGSQGTHRGGHGSEMLQGGGGDKAVKDNIFRGNRPVWAQEGIPEVELGRLNVARSPDHVLNRAEEEALANYSDQMAALYNLTAEAAALLLQTSYGDVVRYDSPLQNLALYEDLMLNGKSKVTGLQPASQLDLAAIFLGSASDKNIPVSEDTVTAVNKILGLPELSPEDVTTLANKAEQVRAGILAGHGDTGH